MNKVHRSLTIVCVKQGKQHVRENWPFFQYAFAFGPYNILQNLWTDKNNQPNQTQLRSTQKTGYKESKYWNNLTPCLRRCFETFEAWKYFEGNWRWHEFKFGLLLLNHWFYQCY